MGDCYICGGNKQLRDVNGNTPQSVGLLDKYMDRWRRRQQLLSEDSQNSK